jgi:hypothetical protein
MPSLCDNRLTISSEDSQTLKKVSDAAAPPVVSKLRQLAIRLGFAQAPRSETGFLHFLRPMPANVEELDIEVLPQLAHQPKSYFWRLENWGCRNDWSFKFEQLSESELQANFKTHYSPPVAALQQGAAQHGFHFRLLYCESGAGFCGIATEAQNNEFEISFDRPPIEEGVPQELIDAFNLHELFLEHAADAE